MTQNKQLSEAFKAYLQAHKNLSALWEASEFGEQFSQQYPFQRSFDDLIGDVEIWVNDAVNRLENGGDGNDGGLTPMNEVAVGAFAKKFYWKDKSGRGGSGPITLAGIRATGAGEENYDGVALTEWAEEAEEGDEWENSTDKYTCIEG